MKQISSRKWSRVAAPLILEATALIGIAPITREELHGLSDASLRLRTRRTEKERTALWVAIRDIRRRLNAARGTR